MVSTMRVKLLRLDTQLNAYIYFTFELNLFEFHFVISFMVS